MSTLKTSKVKAIRKGSIKKVYDIGVEKNHNFFANGHLVSNCFQEQFMSLAVELAGFSPGESDQMRKTLVKKSLDTLDKKGGEKAMLREKFVKGAKEIHGISEDITNALFDKIEFFSLYGFNKSHSVAYAIDSYYAAWLHTHYEKDWLSTILQSASSNPKELSKVISEIKSLGYVFSKHDVNYSGKEWQFSDEADAFVPPLGSVKGIGDTAVEEIMENRPYKDLKTMLYKADGTWRHSKVNKTTLAAMCKIEALESLEDFQHGKVRHHKQLLGALTDGKNYETLRKGIYGLTASQLKKLTKEGIEPTSMIDLLLEEQSSTEDWSRDEKIAFAYEMTSSADIDLLFPPDVMQKLKDREVSSIHDVQPGTDGIGWFLVTEVVEKKTKNGKSFFRCKAIDNESRQGWVRVWGNASEAIQPYTLWVGQVSNDPNWGFSTSIFKIRKVV